MFKYLLFSFCAFFLLFTVIIGCSSSSSPLDEASCEFSKISVSPDGPIELGLFEEVVFEISLEDHEENPIVDGPVFVDFIGPAHNAVVVLYDEIGEEQPAGAPLYDNLYTDQDGKVKVLFTAPDTEAEFSIRFTSPAIEGDASMVDVVVDPTLLKLSLEVDYDGIREIETVEAELFEEVLCEDLGLYAIPLPMDSQSLDEYPGEVSFSGLRNNYLYAVVLNGLNSSFETRAFVCVDGLVPNAPTQSVNLVDTVLDFSGNYTTSSSVAAGDVLDEAVDEIEIAIDESNVVDESNFVSNTHGAILDAIRQVIVAMDPLDGVPFDEIRVEHELDTRLRKLFINNSVDVGESLAPVWAEVKEYLDKTTFTGGIEIGSPDGNSYPVSHRINEFNFGDGPVPGIPVVFDTSYSEPVLSVITLDESNPDMLYFEEHGIVIGLGNVINHLSREALMEHFETPDLASALYDVVECEVVTAYLLPWLCEVAASPAIESGCLMAAEHTQDKLEFGATELNMRYATIEIEGSMVAVVPEKESQVSLFEDGILNLTWSGEDFENQETWLGPMEASFEAELETEENFN